MLLIRITRGGVEGAAWLADLISKYIYKNIVFVISEACFTAVQVLEEMGCIWNIDIVSYSWNARCPCQSRSRMQMFFKFRLPDSETHNYVYTFPCQQ
jgi:hypothetical protein